MWTSPPLLLLLLLLSCFLTSAEAQSDGSRRQDLWHDPIKFNTKAKDLCTMTVRGQGQFTRLRISCRSSERSYWCEYVGKPHTCRPYNKNPRHYFVQMMWGLRKLQNACQAPRQIKPHMCRKASDDSQMLFSSASSSRQWSNVSAGEKVRTAASQGRQQFPPAPTRPGSVRQPGTKTIGVPPRGTTALRTTTTQPVTPPVESTGKRLARRYCWRSLQGICSFTIGLFRH